MLLFSAIYSENTCCHNNNNYYYYYEKSRYYYFSHFLTITVNMNRNYLLSSYTELLL